MRFALALLLVLAAALPGAAAASEATDLAAKIVAAYGGAAAIEKAGSIRQTGQLESYRHGKTGTVERSYRRPDKLRIEIRIPGEAPESRILDGDLAWRDGSAQPPMMAKAMFLQAARLDLPWLILQAGADIRLLGPVKYAEGRELTALEIPMAEGTRLIAVIDPETGYIVRSHGLIVPGPGQQVEFGTLYEDHRQLGAMFVGTRETHFARGQPTGQTTLETSEVVDGFPDGLFKP